MKQLLLAIMATGLTMASFAQKDSTAAEKADTIKIGGMIIIKRTGKDGKQERKVIVNRKPNKKPSNLITNWWIVDLGFSNLIDHSNYTTAAAQGFTGPGIGKDQFNLRFGKSVNVDFWFFMQKLNVASHVLNLKYGLGLELNNYRFDDKRVHFTKNPTTIYLDPAYAGVKKNKLAADYLTVPLMLNFNLTPGRKKGGFGFSAGVSGGLLYSSRQKIKDNGDISKLHGDFNLERFKTSYIGELNIGPVTLYGSYAMKNMWNKGLDQKPYTLGIRLGRL
jgi:hypothetical protein